MNNYTFEFTLNCETYVKTVSASTLSAASRKVLKAIASQFGLTWDYVYSTIPYRLERKW